MKSKLSILAILIISSIGYFSFVNSESIRIQLIEAKSNSPIKSKEIEVYYYQMIFDAPPKLELIKRIKTDDNGNFELPRKLFDETEKGIFGGKEIGIKCGDEYKIATLSINDNQIWFFRYRNGFSQVLAKTRYDLGTMVETNFNYYKDTFDSKFERIKLIAYDNVDYWTKLKERIEKNQKQYEVDQEVLWDYLWTEFVKSVDGENIPPFNTNAWFKHVITCKRLFDLDLKIAFQEAKKVKDPNKKYYYLYSLCLIINNNEGVKDKPDEEIIEWIDREVEKFYKMNPTLELEVKNKKLPVDYLDSIYKAMKERTEK